MDTEIRVRHWEMEWEEGLKILACGILAVTTHLCAEEIDLFLKNYRSECIIYSNTCFSLSLPLPPTTLKLSLETETRALHTLDRHQP